MWNASMLCAHRRAQTVLVLLDIVALVSLLVLPLAWLFNPFEIALGNLRLLRAGWGIRVVATPIVLLLLRAFLAWGNHRSTGRPAPGLLGRLLVKKLLLAVMSTFVILLILEGSLKAIDFKLLTSPLVITGEDQKIHDDSRGLLADPVLRWKYNPGAEFRGRKVNRLGFLDREVEAQKAPGTKRVICMGCSCTAQGPRSYSEMLNEMLQSSAPKADRWEAFNMGVHGYSAVLGRKLFQMRGRDLAPDVVTLYFGWNDHWQSGYWPDSHGIPLEIKSSQVGAIKRLFTRRIVQFLAYIFSPKNLPVSIRGKVRLKHSLEFGNCLRVPPDEYRATLVSFVAEIRTAGAIPMLITAPRGARLTHLIVAHGQAVSVEEAIRLHDQYVAITREVARSEKVFLVDLAADLKPEEGARFFGDDGIHLTLDGRRWVAEKVLAALSAAN